MGRGPATIHLLDPEIPGAGGRFPRPDAAAALLYPPILRRASAARSRYFASSAWR